MVQYKNNHNAAVGRCRCGMKKRRHQNDPAQISLFYNPANPSQSCSCCICRSCLMWWSGRCPYGECYDSHRAAVNPYDKAHPGEGPRTLWSDWKMEQAFWCRGGTVYPAAWCEHYIRYRGSRVEPCLGASVQRFQDGYIRCGFGEKADCCRCYEQYIERRRRK